MRSAPHHRCALRALAVAASALVAACSTQATPIPPPTDHLIVAITDEYGELDPIARYADGVWDRPPWAIGVGLDQLVAAPAADSAAWRWPDGRRIWNATERAWDSIGHSAQAVAVNVPDEWHFYSDSAPVRLLSTRGLHLSAGYQGFAWAVRTRTDWGEPFPHVGDHRTAGVSLSRSPSAALPPDERPDADQITGELGLAPDEGPGVGRIASEPERPVRFIWLGVFQFDDMTIGVLHRLGYGPGVRHAVIELHGDTPRVVAEAGRG